MAWARKVLLQAEGGQSGCLRGSGGEGQTSRFLGGTTGWGLHADRWQLQEGQA